MTTDANTGGSFNRYSYAANNPYKYIDPDGRQERAAEGFVEQHRKDMEAGKGDLYKPLMPVAVAGTAVMGVVTIVAAAPTVLAATQSVLAPSIAAPVVKELSKQELKSVASLAKQAAKHEQKVADFIANPTVRPGMENLPKAQIEAQQAQRINDIRVEIQRSFVDKIMDIIGH